MKYLAFFILFVSSPAFSGQTSGTFEISEVGFSVNSGTVFVTILGIANSPCNANHQFKLDINDPFADKFYSLGLMAYAAGKRLDINYSTDSSGCIGSSGIKPVFVRVRD